MEAFWAQRMAHELDVDVEDVTDAPPRTAPGKVTRTLDLAPRPAPMAPAATGPIVQRRSANADDPFGLHLVDAPASPDAVHAAAAEGLTDAATALPHLDVIQRAFGRHDITGLRAHVGGAAASGAAAIGADAYASGDHVAFAKAPDLHTAAHEAAHAIQQRGGVSLHDGIGADGDSYERHADMVADAVVRGESVEALLDPFAGVLPAAPQATAVQRRRGQPDSEPEFATFQIVVERPMTAEEFRAEVMRQVFGRPVADVRAALGHAEYVPERSPYAVQVSVRALRRHRVQAAGARGIDLTADGEIAGASARARALHDQPPSAARAALMAEIDRRYAAATGSQTAGRIASASSSRADLWRAIRDEVLFEQAYLGSLPSPIREILRAGVRGRDLAPAELEHAFRIARQLAALPPDHVRHYASKLAGSAATLTELEAALARHATTMAARDRDTAAREAVKTELLGLDGVYRLYREYRQTSGIETALSTNTVDDGSGVAVNSSQSDALLRELERQLKAHGFAGIDAFEATIRRWESAFELGSATAAHDLLDRYSARLAREAARYHEQREVDALHDRLHGLRHHHAAYERARDEFHDVVVATQLPALPRNGRLPTRPSPAQGVDAARRVVQALTLANDDLKALAREHPVFQEDELPEDQRISKAALAQADKQQLGAVLQAHLARRTGDLAAVRGRLESKRALVYKMDRLFPLFYAELGIAPESIHDMIIQDKRRSDAVAKLLDNVAVAIVAVALSVVSLGAATPAGLAAVSATAGFGLSVASAYQEYQEYAEQDDLAAIGATDGPSPTWLVVSIVGAYLDMHAAVAAVRALTPAAHALDAGGDVGAFAKAVRELEEAGKLEARVARAAERAATARRDLAEAAAQLGNAAAGKLGSFPGILGDAAFRQTLLRLAKATLRAGYHSADEFFSRVLQARNLRRLEDLTPEDLAAAKRAWAEALESKADDVADGGARALTGGDSPALPAPSSPTAPASTLSNELSQLEGRLRNAGVAEPESTRLTRALETAGVSPARIAGYPANGLPRIAVPKVLDELEQVAVLQRQGRVKGLDDWIDTTRTSGTTQDDLALELRDAIRATREHPDLIAHIGNDLRAPVRPGTLERMRSFDLALETSRGEIVKSIEQTSVGAVRRAHDLGPGVRHAIGKARDRLIDGAPIEGLRYVTIEGRIPPMRASAAGPTGIDRATGERWISTTHVPPMRKHDGNLYDEVASYLDAQKDSSLLDGVTLLDRTGEVISKWERLGTTWRIAR